MKVFRLFAAIILIMAGVLLLTALRDVLSPVERVSDFEPTLTITPVVNSADSADLYTSQYLWAEWVETANALDVSTSDLTWDVFISHRQHSFDISSDSDNELYVVDHHIE